MTDGRDNQKSLVRFYSILCISRLNQNRRNFSEGKIPQFTFYVVPWLALVCFRRPLKYVIYWWSRFNHVSAQWHGIVTGVTARLKALIIFIEIINSLRLEWFMFINRRTHVTLKGWSGTLSIWDEYFVLNWVFFKLYCVRVLCHSMKGYYLLR